MPGENVDIARRVFESFSEGVEHGDFSAAFRTGLLAPEFEWVAAPEVPGPRTFRGDAEFNEFMRTWTEDFDSWRIDLDELIEAPNGGVVAIVHQRGTGKSSGAPVELRFGIVYEIKDGRVTRLSAFLDPDEALEKAGVGN